MRLPLLRKKLWPDRTRPGTAVSARTDSAVEINSFESCRFSVWPTTIGQKNDELRFPGERETSHRKQTTETRRSHVFFFQSEDGIRDKLVTGVQTCALPI